MKGSLALALVLHISLHSYALAQFSEAKNIVAVLMSFVLYPSAVAVYASLRKAKEDAWARSRCVEGVRVGRIEQCRVWLLWCRWAVSIASD